MSKPIKIYTLLIILTLAGYIWLFVTLNKGEADATICLFKQVTGIPCPSCGSSRSVLSVLDGHWAHAILINPLGLMAVFLLAIIPLWLVYDGLTRQASLYKVFLHAEQTIKKPIFAIPLILLLLANWVWNIFKAL
jgi:hypothetical protein